MNTLSAGGAELHLLTLCRHLRRRNVDVTVAYLKEIQGSRSLRADFEKEGIDVIDLRAHRRFAWRFPFRLAKVIAETRPDILHTHLPRADFGGGAMKWLRCDVPWVCSVHDIHSKHWTARSILPLIDVLWRRCDAVIAISGAVRDWLVDERGLQSERVFLIHYGIDVAAFVGDGGDRPAGAHAPVVGMIGRLEPRKGHHVLIRAMPAILEKIPTASLWIAGHDPESHGPFLQRLIHRLNLENSVRLVGFQRDVPRFLQAIDVLAFPSRFEGFGLVALEAMAAGKPVVASRIAPLTEIVVDGETGILAEANQPAAFGDAVSWLLAHPEEARRMGLEGRRRAREAFSAERMAQHTLAVYETALQRPAGAGGAKTIWEERARM